MTLLSLDPHVAKTSGLAFISEKCILQPKCIFQYLSSHENTQQDVIKIIETRQLHTI